MFSRTVPKGHLSKNIPDGVCTKKKDIAISYIVREPPGEKPPDSGCRSCLDGHVLVANTNRARGATCCTQPVSLLFRELLRDQRCRVLGQKFSWRTNLVQLAFFDPGEPVAALDSAQPVDNNDDGEMALGLLYGLHDGLFRAYVQSRGGFVENEHVRPCVQGPGYRDLSFA